MRIGLIGTDSDHAEDALRLFNRDVRHPGFAVAGLWGSDAGRTRDLAAKYGLSEVAAGPDGLLGKVEAVIVGARHGGLHLAHALPYLEAGVPMFVDKPLACSVVDAERMLDAAAKSGTPVLSASALRWQPDTLTLKRHAEALGQVERIVVTGSFYPKSEYGGSVFYAVHSVELALELAGAMIEDVVVELVTASAMTITGRVAATRVEMQMIRPAEGEGTSFSAELISAKGQVGGSITLPKDYMAPVFDRFVAMLKSGVSPMSREELLAPVRVLELGEATLRKALGR
jgi:predicted dehydrogenase